MDCRFDRGVLRFVSITAQCSVGQDNGKQSHRVSSSRGKPFRTRRIASHSVAHRAAERNPRFFSTSSAVLAFASLKHHHSTTEKLEKLKD